MVQFRKCNHRLQSAFTKKHNELVPMWIGREGVSWPQEAKVEHRWSPKLQILAKTLYKRCVYGRLNTKTTGGIQFTESILPD